jgi:cytochrome c oxidase subunit II
MARDWSERTRTGRTGWKRLLRPVPLVLLAGLGLQLAGCGGDSPSTLDPHGTGATRVAGLWWLLFWIATAVAVVVFSLLAVALARRRGEDVRIREGGGTGLVVVGGAVLPAIILAVVFIVGVRDQAELARTPATGLTIEVLGHDWWWEVRYPDEGVVTANEIHVPVGRPVRFRLFSTDVNHSFWVPQLMPKKDLLAGQWTETWGTATRGGVYRGQCAEYCGLQHANMAFLVVADAPADFDRWLAAERAPAVAPVTEPARRGQDAFLRNSCASCHTLRGTAAAGRLGPDLTHFGSRRTIGAATVPNNRGNLGGWIANAQTVKPGNGMPPQPLDPDELQAILAYLESLR